METTLKGSSWDKPNCLAILIFFWIVSEVVSMLVIFQGVHLSKVCNPMVYALVSYIPLTSTPGLQWNLLGSSPQVYEFSPRS